MQPELGQYNENVLQGLDFLLAEMEKRNMYAVVYLNNFWIWSGGMAQYGAWTKGVPLPNPFFEEYTWHDFMNFSAGFYTNPEANEYYRIYLKMLINRKNTVTGVRYKDDPTIMSWQLANEPRPGEGEQGKRNFTVFGNWIDETASYIKSLDVNHLVSTGNEGLAGAMWSDSLYKRIHSYEQIDYLTFHLWLLNWTWFDPIKAEETYPEGAQKASGYIEAHIGYAREVGKPLVLEEFGLPRDGHIYSPKASTKYRDQYFDLVFSKIVENARNGGPLAGSNFWTWGGFGKARDPQNAVWKQGDDFTGDPPQEPQGRNSVFVTDSSTVEVLKKYAGLMNEIKVKKMRNSIFAIFLVFLFSCSQNNNPIVAEFGDQQITLEEFKIAYLDILKKPDVFDSPALREKFLDELIASRVLAEEAKKRGYDKDEKLQYKSIAYKNKALREAHFNAVIRPMFSVREKDVQEVYIFNQEERKISHLFADTKQEIDSIYTLLERGGSFEAIAKDLFDNPVLVENGGDLGWIHWDALEYDMAMAAFRMQIGEFSAPIRSQFGYHILKVTDYKKKPLITRMEYEQHRDKAKAMLEYKLGDKLAFEHVSSMFDKAEIDVNPGVATAVRSKLKEIFQRKPNQYNEMNEMQLTDDEVNLVEVNVWDMRHDRFATINGKTYTVGEFIGALNYIPYSIIHNSFRKTMSYAFRDFLIESEAREFGLENEEEALLKSNLYNEYLLQLALRRELVNNTKVSEDEILHYYEQNNAQFKGAEFGQVRKTIENILYRNKRAQVIPDFVQSLLASRNIIKNVELIQRYYDSLLD